MAFTNDLAESSLPTSAPTNCRDYLAGCDKTLRKLIDKHAPLKSTVLLNRATVPGFNSICRQANVKARRLEKEYRASRSTVAFRLWKIKSDIERRVYQTAPTDCRSMVINSCPDSRTLWRKVSALLEPTETSTGPHSADDFAVYFTGKVAIIRASSAGALPPSIRLRLVRPLSCLNNVTLEEVVKAMQKSPSTQRDLHPAQTWLVKKCGDILGLVIKL